MDSDDSLPGKLDKSEIKAMLKAKGWKAKEVAERWNLTERRMSQIITDPERNQYYDDAFRGLPSRK